MATDQYLSLFYPFDQLDVVKKGIESHGIVRRPGHDRFDYDLHG